MRLKNYIIIIVLLSSQTCTAQKTKYERVSFTYYKLPAIALDSQYKTYSVAASIPDYMGGNYLASTMSYAIPPLKKTAMAGDIEVQLSYPMFTEYSRPEQHGQVYNTKVNGRDTSYTMYYYNGSYRQGYEYRIKDNITGKEYAKDNFMWMIGVQTDQYKDPGEAARQYNIIYMQRIGAEASKRHKELAGTINSIVNNLFYKGDAGTYSDVYRMKDKDDYADLDSASEIAIKAYSLITAADKFIHSKFTEAIQPAIAIWQRALSQQEDSKKARINKKAANIILFNLAQAAYWSADYKTAMEYAKKADENGKSDFWVDGFEKTVQDTQGREAANGVKR